MSMGDSIKSQLASAFSALDESDQYDAVLTGLCAKILDQPSEDLVQVTEALQDPIQLMEEMNARRIKAGSRSLMALVDVSHFQRLKIEGQACESTHPYCQNLVVFVIATGRSDLARCQTRREDPIIGCSKWRNCPIW